MDDAPINWATPARTGYFFKTEFEQKKKEAVWGDRTEAGLCLFLFFLTEEAYAYFYPLVSPLVKDRIFLPIKEANNQITWAKSHLTEYPGLIL